MKRVLVFVLSCAWVLNVAFAAPASLASPVQAKPVLKAAAASGPVYDDSGFYQGAAGLSPSEAAGREIWYKAAAGNERFHTYVFPQRVGVLIDWYRVLRGDQREERFKAWGLINDPGCCVPGSPNCPAKSYEETYGFDWCPGDEALLQSVGKSDYRDPACDFKDAALEGIANSAADPRQSSCDLGFGTSTGALGLRKFPNPKFNAAQWRKLNGGKLGSWEGYNNKLSAQQDHSDSQVSHLLDGSIEPPFRIGMACGACHIAFDPAHPPKDPTHPQWENIKGLVGNQYSRLSEIMVSGMGKNSLEWQVFSHARPGTTDTSAVPTDQVNNPGTINALINVKQRPTFANEAVTKWRKVAACKPAEPESTCWCEPGKPGKCWSKSAQNEAVHHILKGGEDSIGASEALQRVFINIGSCAEQCWVNHLTDLRQLDPQQRGFGQTPFNIGQCRRDCANFRAVEDRLENVRDFVLSAEGGTADLRRARELAAKAAKSSARFDQNDLTETLEKEFGLGAVTRGRLVFAENCARCHSSIPESAADAFKHRDFLKVSEAPEAHGLRADWMGNDQATPVSEVGTFRCRALHSNHMTGHVWQEYGSDTLRARGGDPNVREPGDGGRGYYRNVSLLNVWAHAPFMHNNAVGPELCGGTANVGNEFYRSPYADVAGDKAAACWPYDPSVDGRFKLYKESMRQLLSPKERVPKITKLDEDIILDLGPKLWDGADEKKLFGFTLSIPKGTNAGLLGNFQHKQFIVDLVLSKTKPAQLESKLTKSLGSKEKAQEVAAQMRQVADEILKDPAHLIKAVGQRLPLVLDVYSSCTADVENAGHRFGEDLPEPDKQALTAFMATL